MKIPKQVVFDLLNDLLLEEGMWNAMALEEGKRSSSVLQVAVSGWEKQRNGYTTPWTATHQASLSFTISQSLLKFMSIKSVMPSNHLVLCCPLLLLPSVFSSTRAFCNESALGIRWSKYWSFSFSISPSNEYSGLISFRELGTTAFTYPRADNCLVLPKKNS